MQARFRPSRAAGGAGSRARGPGADTAPCVRPPIGSPTPRSEPRALLAPVGARRERPSDPHELARARLFGLLAEERALLASRARVHPAPLGFRSPAPAAASSRGGLRARLSALVSRRARNCARQYLRGLRLPTQVGLVSLVVYLVLFNFSIVRGSSMAPGIRDGDRILIDQVSYLFRGVQRGDVVVLRYPLDPRVDYIKRVVGLPGDEVRILGAQVFVNGDLLEEPYVAEPDRRSYLSTVVRPGHYFVLGDNRPHSADSREFGQVPHGCLRGKVDLRVWPVGRMGLID